VIRSVVDLDCRAGEGGAGVVRVALPLAVLHGRRVRLHGIRVDRRDRGLGWPHLCYIETLCRWTGARALGAAFGATEFVFEPGERQPSGTIAFNLDEPTMTFELAEISVRRAYADGSDEFGQLLNNRDGKGVRGHSLVTPLLGLLPLLVAGDGTTEVNASGSTETPGAPFVDAVAETFIPFLNALADKEYAIDVQRRGILGHGGGRALTRRTPAATTVAAACDALRGRLGPALPTLSARFFVFGGVAARTSLTASCHAFCASLEERLSRPIPLTVVETDYPLERIQQLYLIRVGDLCRDVSVCWEESSSPLDVDRVCTRLLDEIGNAMLPSRFLVEQLLPVASVLSRNFEFITERWTGHLAGAAHAVEAITGRSVTVQDREAFVRVLVT